MPDRDTLDFYHHPLCATQLIAGLDVGRAKDHSALAIVRKSRDEAGQAWCALVFAQQWRLGITYPQLAADVGDIFRQLHGLSRFPDPPALICDSTGVGAPLVDVLREAGLDPIAATITAGSDWSRNGSSIRVPKALLASELQIMFQTGRLAIAADIPFRSQLERELTEFRVSISPRGTETFEAASEKVHDDLVCAVALAAFASARYFGARPQPFFFSSRL